MQAYERDKTLFGFVASLFGNIVVIAFIFGGLLDRYNAWIASLNLSFAVSGWLFFLLLSYADEIVSVPFSLYTIFRIENKYGFNTMTLRLWIVGFYKISADIDYHALAGNFRGSIAYPVEPRLLVVMGMGVLFYFQHGCNVYIAVCN